MGHDGSSFYENEWNDSVGTKNLSEDLYIYEKNNVSSKKDPVLELIGFGIPNTALANKIVHYCFGVLLIFIGVAGATGNGLVIYVFARYRRLRGGGVPLILSLAAGDFSVSLLHFLPAYSSFKETWSFGKLGCELYAAAVGLCGLASLLTLSVIAAERFSVIMGTPVRWLSSKKACALIWIFSFVLVFPPFVGWSKYELEGVGTSCSWDYTSRDFKNRMYYIFLLVFGFFIPVSIIIISYLGILHVVCKQSSRWHGISRNDGLSKKSPTRSDLKTSQVVLTIIICFLIAWTPYAVCSMIGQFGDASLLSPLSTALPAVFAKSSIIYNPFVYALSHPLFRTAFAALKTQYLGKQNSSGISLHVRNRNHYSHRRNKFQRGGNTGTANRGTKTKLVVTAKDNGTCSTRPYNRSGFHLDGQKMQFDGFKGKIPSHLLRHFTGNNTDNVSNSKTSLGNTPVNALVHHQSSMRSNEFDMENDATMSSCSPTTPSTSFRSKHNVRRLKKGAWVFKEMYEQPSDSEITTRTAVPTHVESSVSSVSDSDRAVRGRTDHYKSILKRENSKGDSKRMKNSYTFFFCEYRKRRQETIQQTFYRRGDSLSNNSRAINVRAGSVNGWDGTVEQEREVSGKAYLPRNYYSYDGDHFPRENNLNELPRKKANVVFVRNSTVESDGNDISENDDHELRRIDKSCSFHDYKHQSMKNGLVYHLNRPTSSKCEPIGISSSLKSVFNSCHDTKHFNFIKEENSSTMTMEGLSRQNVKQGNIHVCSLYNEKEERGKPRKEIILPKNDSLQPLCASTKENAQENVCKIVTSESNPGLGGCHGVRKTVSLSGLKVLATKSISYPSKMIPTKKGKVDIFTASGHGKRNTSAEKESYSMMNMKNNAGIATKKNIASFLPTFHTDNDSSASQQNKSNSCCENGVNGDCNSPCESESSYASCRSDFYTLGWDEFGVNDENADENFPC